MDQTKTYVVALPSSGQKSIVTVAGTASHVVDTTLTLVPTHRRGVYHLNMAGTTIPVFVETDGIDHVTLHVRGYAYTARVLESHHHELIAVLEASPAMKTRVVKVTAPMPGLLKSIFVKEAEHVGKGQALFTLEAMKMENSISAPHAGTIRSLTAREGLAVEKGAPLCVIDPA